MPLSAGSRDKHRCEGNNANSGRFRERRFYRFPGLCPGQAERRLIQLVLRRAVFQVEDFTVNIRRAGGDETNVMDASKKQREPVAFKSLAELKRFIRPGVEFKTVSHANHADMVGLTRVVTTVQTVGFYSKVKDQPEHPFSTCNHGRGRVPAFLWSRCGSCAKCGWQRKPVAGRVSTYGHAGCVGRMCRVLFRAEPRSTRIFGS